MNRMRGSQDKSDYRNPGGDPEQHAHHVEIQHKDAKTSRGTDTGDEKRVSVPLPRFDLVVCRQTDRVEDDSGYYP